jgi:hypothetical protein
MIYVSKKSTFDPEVKAQNEHHQYTHNEKTSAVLVVLLF